MASQNKDSLKNQIRQAFDDDSQVEEMVFKIGSNELTVFYVDSLIDKKLFAESVLKPIESLTQNPPSATDLISFLQSQVISVSGTSVANNSNEAVTKILSGSAVLVCGQKALVCPVYGLQARGVAEPPTSRVVKGPREGFVEDLPRNLGLIRKRLKTPNLKIKELCVGRQTKTNVSVVWLDGIAKPEIVSEVEKRISAIDIDAVIDSYYIESFLENNHLKFFRRVGNTEKPDVLCAKILEGRVAILVDGSPIALSVPFMLFEDLQSPQDYYTIPAQASFVRVMRILGLIFAVLMPGVYVALESFNYRILPVNFLITLLSNIEGLSVPPLIELLIVLFLFEVITEASLQMPNSLGMALSIIGALALGNTAVDAGIISPPSIVVVAISSVALYIIPDQISETRLLRILFTVVGGIAGLYGILTSFILLTTYLCSIKSFGVPYMTPIAPKIKKDKHDSFFKESVQDSFNRPEFIAGKNKTRVGEYDTSKFKTEKELASLNSSKKAHTQKENTKNKNLQNENSQKPNKKSAKNQPKTRRNYDI